VARIKLVNPESIQDPIISEILEWVIDMEGRIPNHFLVELNFPEFFKAKLSATKTLWEMGELSMEEIQHIGIAVSKTNNCQYCTAAFCTILTYGLKENEDYMKAFLNRGSEAVADKRLKLFVDVALKVNNDPFSVTDEDMEQLRDSGLTDKGILQLLHLVSDFASYNRLNIALQTDYDYRDIWKLR
jgi:uncharacterized peroxidase-related enzyme